MFERPWSGSYAYLACVICLLVLVSWGSWDWSAYLTEERVRAEKTAEYHDQYAEDAIDEKCLGLELPAMRDCIHEQIETARDHERSEQDLDAQQAMARFTRVMGWTAIVGLILGLISIIVIFRTLSETRKATEVANRTLRATWDIGKAQAEPLLVCEGARSAPVRQDMEPEIVVQIRNTGQSGALSLRTAAWLEFPTTPKETIQFQLPQPDANLGVSQPFVLKCYPPRKRSWEIAEQHKPDISGMLTAKFQYETRFEETFVFTVNIETRLLYTMHGTTPEIAFVPMTGGLRAGLHQLNKRNQN